MKKTTWVMIGISALLASAAISYLWATAIMDSLYAFRSPFASAPLPGGAPVEARLTRSVVAILVDGLRVDTAANADVMPFLNQLRTQGASAVIHSRPPSYSAPAWSVLMIGAWPELSDGPAMNPTEGESIPAWTQDNVFTAIHKLGLKTAFSGTYYFPQGIPAAALDDSFLVYEETVAADQETTAAAINYIQSQEYPFLLVHLNQVDYAGHHEGGPKDARWNQAAARSDQLIEKIVSSLDLNQDSVLIFSDHGQIDSGGHGGQDAVVLIQPFVVAGAGVKPGEYPDIQQVDIAPTITALLGANIPALSQGRVLTEMFQYSDPQLTELVEASRVQQKALYSAYAKALDVVPQANTIEGGKEPVSVYQAAMNELKETRLHRERLPRFVLAGFLLLLAIYLVVKRRPKNFGWYLLGTGIYLGIFHLAYGLIFGRTYSLSSVLSSGDIILTSAICTSLGYVIAWLIATATLKMWRQEPLQAGLTHLGFTFTVLGIVFLPAVWSFAFNGPLVAWTLPDMASTFLAFLSILQGLVVAALGLVFFAVTWLTSKRKWAS